MTDTNLSRLDEWLTTEPQAPVSAYERDDDALITRFMGTCIHCADHGCKHCEGPEGEYDEEAELDAMEGRYESYLDRS